MIGASFNSHRRASCRPPGSLGAVALACVVSLLSLSVAPSCNYLGPAVAIISGPPTKPAVYELDPNLTYVIFIDDLRSRLPKRSLRDVIAGTAEETILSEGLLNQDHLISAAATRRIAASDSSENMMSIVEVGRRVGADVVIYVTIDGFLLSRDNVAAMPTVLSRMKLLDVEKNERLWPGNDEGYSVIVQPQRQQGDLPTDLAGRNAMEVALAKKFGVAIAQCFYKHEIRNSATSN